MMEAFLDEQNTLIRPLVARKLALVHLLETRSEVVESLLAKTDDPMIANRLADDLEQLAEEKVHVCEQLLDLVRRPYDTILEVEAALQTATEREQEVVAPTARRSSAPPAAPPAEPPAPAPMPTELWCFCRKPDDGRQMIGCDNNQCDITWWHADCLDAYITTHQIGAKPDESTKWHCPICVAAELVTTEKKRRRRSNQ